MLRILLSERLLNREAMNLLSRIVFEKQNAYVFRETRSHPKK